MYYGVVSLDPARFAYSHVEAAAAGQPIQSSTAPTETDGGSTNVQTKNDIKILPAVLSIGYNPFYKNEVKSIVCLPHSPGLFLHIYIPISHLIRFLNRIHNRWQHFVHRNQGRRRPNLLIMFYYRLCDLCFAPRRKFTSCLP